MKTATLVIGALLLGGGLYLYSEHQKTAASSPSLESRAMNALATETNPYVLTALSDECDKAGRSDLASLLTAKAKAIFAMQGPTQTKDYHPAAQISMMAAGAPASNATLSLAQAVLGGGVHAPRERRPDPVDPNLSPQGL